MKRVPDSTIQNLAAALAADDRVLAKQLVDRDPTLSTIGLEGVIEWLVSRPKLSDIPRIKRPRRSARGTITVKSVEALKIGHTLRDDRVRGFEALRLPSGVVTYRVRYTAANGVRRLHSLGTSKEIKVANARTAAEKLRVELRGGVDPVAKRIEERRRAVTAAEAFETGYEDPASGRRSEPFLTAHVEAKRKPATHDEYERLWNAHLKPTLGKRPMVEIEHADIAALHHAMRATPAQANRVAAVASSFFNWSARVGLRRGLENPCRHLQKYREQGRERFLSDAELGFLGDALAEAEQAGMSPYAVAAIRLLLFTGMRRGEVLGLKWEYVDGERQLLRLPDSKTGAKVILLNAPALAVLAGIRRINGNPFVFPGAKDGAAIADAKRTWHALRERATILMWSADPDAPAAKLVAQMREELEREPTHAEIVAEAQRLGLDLPRGLVDVRIHDLRHTNASVGAAAGLSLPAIGRLLGHRTPATTQRYAHLADDPLRRASEAIGERIDAAMKRKPAAPVEDMAKHRSRRGRKRNG